MRERRPARKWLILGPARYELPVYAWQLEALAFFDHVLRGADNGYAEQAPVRYWVEGAERLQAGGGLSGAGQHAPAISSVLGWR